MLKISGRNLLLGLSARKVSYMLLPVFCHSWLESEIPPLTTEHVWLKMNNNDKKVKGKLHTCAEHPHPCSLLLVCALS